MGMGNFSSGWLKVARHTAIFLVCAPGVRLNAQTLFDKMRQVPIGTPHAAAFTKYVEFPVNFFNGLPNISVPLYTIESGDISIPISLSYHAGGIKISEEASLVGLGWNLSANGVISRQINGKDDFLQPEYNYFNKVFPDQAYSYNENYANKANYTACLAYGKDGRPIIETYPGSQLYTLATKGDGEPDTYIYNFLNYSGKFISSQNQIHDINRNNIRFTVSMNKITALSPDGYYFEFSDLEKGWVDTNPLTVISYYLSKIVSPTGKEVTFQYEYLNNVRQLTSWSEEYVAKSGQSVSTDGPLVKSKSYSNANPVYLAKIIFDGGYVDFIRGSRQDMYGKKLDRIEVHYNNGSLLRKFTFEQSYFISANSTRHYLEDVAFDPFPYPEDFLKKRLRLDAVIEEGDGSDTNEKPKRHRFEYYDGGNYSLPYKSSWAADFWGFYNGKGTNVGFIPDTKGFHLVSDWPSITDYDGSNRDTDSECIKAGTLKKIVYPSKGSTEYTYSAHRYTNIYSAPAKYRWTTTAPAIDYGQGVNEATFSLASGRDVKIMVSLYCDCAANYCLCNGNEMKSPWTCGNLTTNGYSNNILYAELRKLNPSTGVYEFINWDLTWDVNDILPCNINANNSGIFEKTLRLEAGTYKLIANYPDNKTGELGSKMASIQAGFVDEYYETNPIGGGLRVDQIKHHDPEKNVDLVSTFEYANGMLMKFPTFNWRRAMYEHRPNPSGDEDVYYKYFYDYLYSNTITPISVSANGNPVGYGKVTEKRENGETGKIEYQYEVSSDNFNVSDVNNNLLGYVNAYAPGIPSTTHLKNGFLKEMTLYDVNNTPVKKTFYTSEVVAAETFWSFRGQSGGGDGLEFPNTPCNTPAGRFFMYYFYPVQMGKVVPSQSTEYVYANGAPITTTTNYGYNLLTYTTSEQKILSDGRVSLSQFKYLPDYDTTSGWLKDMNKRNLIGKPLEEFYKIDGKMVAGSFIKYQAVGNKILPSETYNVEINLPTVISSTVPLAVIPPELKLSGTVVYNTNGSISYSQAKDNVVTTYIWDQYRDHSIAVIQNAMPSEVFHTSFEDLATGFSTISKTGIKAYNGTAAFSVPLPPAGGAYTLTYWKKTGANDWQFVEDSMSASKLIGGNGILIDEVRVLKSSAKMTTYTYDHLKGMTSMTDSSNISNYFEYDSFGRLKAIRDDQRKVLKTFMYHYAE